MTADLKNAQWFKSTKSSPNGHCVETAFLENNGVAVRDSKNPDGSVLLFTAAEWTAFVAGVQGGEFNLR